MPRPCSQETLDTQRRTDVIKEQQWGSAGCRTTSLHTDSVGQMSRGTDWRRRGCGSDPGRWRKQLLKERISHVVTRLSFSSRLFFPQAVVATPPEHFASFGGLEPAARRCTAVSCSVIVSIFSSVLERMPLASLISSYLVFSFFFPFLSQQVWLHNETFRLSSQLWGRSR